MTYRKTKSMIEKNWKNKRRDANRHSVTLSTASRSKRGEHSPTYRQAVFSLIFHTPTRKHDSKIIFNDDKTNDPQSPNTYDRGKAWSGRKNAEFATSALVHQR